MDDKSFYIYILTNCNNTVLYTGVTNDLMRRVFEHKNHVIKGFTDKYNCTKLVYFESTSCINSAITREKQLKGWRRAKKESLISFKKPEVDRFIRELVLKG